MKSDVNLEKSVSLRTAVSNQSVAGGQRYMKCIKCAGPKNASQTDANVTKTK